MKNEKLNKSNREVKENSRPSEVESNDDLMSVRECLEELIEWKESLPGMQAFEDLEANELRECVQAIPELIAIIESLDRRISAIEKQVNSASCI